MSKINYSNGKFFLEDGGQYSLLVDIRTSSENRSRVHSHQFNEKGGVEFPLTDTVKAATKNIFRQTPESLAEVVTYLRIVARLLKKPQIHSVLRVGNWSPLNESLAEILPQFNPANKFYCLSEMRPLGKIPSVNFIFAEGEEFPLPENKFDTIILSGRQIPSLEMLLTLKDYGKIYFTALNSSIEEPLKSLSKIFPLTAELSLLELEISPHFKVEIKRRTPQGIFEEKKAEIIQVVSTLPDVIEKFRTLPRKKRNAVLDKYIAEFSRAEKILAEIFPELHSDTIKFNFNVLKETLIDLRLDNGSLAHVDRQYEILTKDFNQA